MKILLTFFVLFFSSSVFAELPISLFGVEILEKGEIYKIDPDINRPCNSYFFSEEKTKPRNKNIKFKKNDLFDRQCIRMDDDGIIHTINGFKMWDFNDDFEKSNLNELGLEDYIKIQQEIIKNLASQYKVSEEKFNVTYVYEVVNEFRMLNIFFYVKYKNKQKGKLYLYGNFKFNKEKDPSSGAGKVGSGMISFELTSQKERFNSLMESIQKREDVIINVNELDDYIEFFKSSYSVF